jgi:ribonucleoside-triphosphate reductase
MLKPKLHHPKGIKILIPQPLNPCPNTKRLHSYTSRETQQTTSAPHRARGFKVLKAISSPLRLQILNLLFDKGALSYTELMSSLKMNPNRDAGKFAYHLKFLLSTDLVEADTDTRKYLLTDLGKMVIDVADHVEKDTQKTKRLLVRTSRSSLETFDANKIADSLIKESKMPPELAQRVAKETEKRLYKSRTRYVTAPLVREIVNAILIEKGLEEYRHKLTRLGLPVHEVTALLETRNQDLLDPASKLKAAGEATFKEYILLNVLPRDISDAHLSGSIHINNLSSWILTPKEIVHDLRFFLKNGINREKADASRIAIPPPQNLDQALFMAFSVLLGSANEVSETQTVEYFNIFLAPFAKGIEPSRIKETLRSFILNLSQHVNASLGLELAIPDFVAEKSAFGPPGKQAGKYGDFNEEGQLLASLLLDILSDENAAKPTSNPKIVVKIRHETFNDEHAKALLLKAHSLVANGIILYFANLLDKKRGSDVLSSSGCRLPADDSEDWEIDTLRTGCLGHVTINMPRMALESDKEKTKFLELLKEGLELAAGALEIKYRALSSYSKDRSAFLTQNADGDQYFRLQSCTRQINLIGLKEATETLHGKNITEDENGFRFAEETLKSMSDYAKKMARRYGKRLSLAMLPDFEASERLALLDIEKYGVAKAHYSGTREKPFYSATNRASLTENGLPLKPLMMEQRLQALCPGGNLTLIDLGPEERKPEELMSITKQLAESSAPGLLTYNRKLTHCDACKKNWFGFLRKCPSCGAVSTLTYFDRFAST